MIVRKEIEVLIELFEARGVSLYHACQLMDLRSYLRIGGIPSRALLTAASASFTGFETDTSDHENEVWDKVFLNLADFGRSFASGGSAVPNPYGPILLQINPRALQEASDVAICLRSAGAANFSREREALGTIRDIDRLFAYPATSGFPDSTYVKYSRGLQREFDHIDVHDPEMSCTTPTGMITSKYIVSAIVDTYTFGEDALQAVVYREKTAMNLAFGVTARRYKNKRSDLLDELGRVLCRAILCPTLSDLSDSGMCSDTLATWAHDLSHRGLGYQFNRFAKYLREGTITPIGTVQYRA